MSAGTECLNPSLSRLRAVYKGVDEPYRVFFVNILVDGIGKEHCLVSAGSVDMFAHGFSVGLKLSLKLNGK